MNKRLVPPHSRSAHGTQSCTAYIIIRCTKKTKACRRRASSKTTESGNPPEARRAVGPTTRRSCCRRANHCPLMPALPPRQAHSCRPRPRPVLAPHPDAAAPNTEHRTRPSRGSGTPAPARRGAQPPHPWPPERGARRGSGSRQRRGLPPRTRVARGPAHAHTLFSRSRVAQRSRDSVERTDRRRCGKIQHPHRSRSRPVHTCLPRKAHDTAAPSHLPFFFPEICTPAACRLLDAAMTHGFENYFVAANWPQ